MKINIIPLKWENETLYLLDQRLLPAVEEYVTIESIEDCYKAIQQRIVRGAALTGFTAVWGLTSWLKSNVEKVSRINRASLLSFKETAGHLKTSSPSTANLAYEINECIGIAERHHIAYGSLSGLYTKMVSHANDRMHSLEQSNLQIAETAARLLEEKLGGKPLRLMTIANSGTLACGCLGTGLGVIMYLESLGRVENVFVCETRPYFHGSRLTSYELLKQDIGHTIIIDSAAACIMDKYKIDAVFAGADRIVANGDTAGKTGTSMLSILSKHYNVPFYIAAPISTFDFSIENGDTIPIEMRPQDDILSLCGKRIALEQVIALNPLMDVTRADNITAVICEKGLISPVNKENISIITGNRF